MNSKSILVLGFFLKNDLYFMMKNGFPTLYQELRIYVNSKMVTKYNFFILMIKYSLVILISFSCREKKGNPF
ncbi:unnamed protein product [Rhizophagus irregularis]|nr:unnamed protein product [Rhizophagus irregularis]CAB5363486.1 unnamed protein product [Rhizophagus irregularis]